MSEPESPFLKTIQTHVETRSSLVNSIIEGEIQNLVERRRIAHSQMNLSDETLLYLTSANAALRANVLKNLDINREASITEIANGDGELEKNLKDFFRDHLYRVPLAYGDEIPFELCTRNPREIIADYAGDLDEDVAHAMGNTAELFARCKAFRGIRPESKNECQRYDSSFSYGFNIRNEGIEESSTFDADSSSTIVFDRGNKYTAIKCATLPKLVERMTEDPDLNIRYVFFLTYHSFTTSRELLQVLVDRYFTPYPDNHTPSELEYFDQKRLLPIRLKTVGALRYWIKEHFQDFLIDDEFRVHLRELLSSTLVDSPWSEKICQNVLGVLTRKEGRSSKRSVFEIPVSLYGSSDMQEFRRNFLDSDALEFARQVTWKDSITFRDIISRELLSQRWSKHPDEACHVVSMIDRHNRMANWVQRYIMACDDLKLRIRALDHILTIAGHLLDLHNFHSLFAVFSGLSSIAVHRLKKTWEGVPSKSRMSFDHLQVVFSNDKSRKALRDTMAKATAPVIPQFSLFLGDLTFIEEGNPDTIDSMINFNKRCMLAERIRIIKGFQQHQNKFDLPPLTLKPDPVYQLFLIEDFESMLDEDSLYSKSISLEPVIRKQT